MRLSVLLVAVLSVSLGGSAVARAQEPAPAAPVDSIVVQGNQRLTAEQVVSTAGLAPHQVANYRDVQRAITALFKTGQFDDVSVEQKTEGGKVYLVFTVKERPMLLGWTVRGFERIPEGTVRDRVKLVNGKPLDRDALERSRAAIDSLYKKQGYYAAIVTDTTLAEPDGAVRVVFDIAEGRRVAVSEVEIDGNQAFPDKAVVKHMATRPEGFLWFQNGQYD
ncbi:MAG TPA: POTRA domain-containing protein, partial [Gemmatimonadales bacterium]